MIDADIKTDAKTTDTNFRFKFGKNWRNYINSLSEDRVLMAMNSLTHLLDMNGLNEKSFIDIGCGSGIFSLAALKLGAKQVISIDYDQDSVGCARYLNEKYGPFDNWDIQQGSILDSSLVNMLGKHDVVYSWGVLHHTGAMWTALRNAAGMVEENGLLAISIYNDQGWLSRCWTGVKYIYNKSPRPIQWLLGNAFFVFWALLMLFVDVIKRRSIFARYRGINARGMNAYYDAIDWIGGYPFEVSTPDKIIAFYKEKGFSLEKLETRPGMGCNEFVFKKNSS